MLIGSSLIFPQWDMVGSERGLWDESLSLAGYSHPLRIPSQLRVRRGQGNQHLDVLVEGHY